MEGKALEGWELMKIRGIPLKVHPSWFLILILFTWTAQAQVTNSSEFSSLPILSSWFIGFVTALLLFLSVLLHELGHSFVALHEGVKVKSITLFFLGGFANIERDCSTAMASFRVAIAGPLVSFIIALILLWIVPSSFQLNPLSQNLVVQIGSLNLLLGLFNLLPGLPLDGGVILKALVWQFTGSQKKGIEVANATGRTLSIFAILIGILFCFLQGNLGGLWLIVIGWFGLASSRSQSQILLLQKALIDLKVCDSSGRRFRVLESNQPLRAISKLSMNLENEKRIPDWILICSSGRWIGYVDDQSLKNIPVQYWDKNSVGEHVKPLSELPSISDDDPLWKAVLSLEKSSNGRILVFNRAGLPSGTIDRIDLGKRVLNYLGISLPDPFIQSAREQNIYPLGLSLPQIVDSMLAVGMVENHT